MIKDSQSNKNKIFAIAGMMPVILTGIFSTVAAQSATTEQDIKHLDALLARANPEQDCVHVDDMRIKASSLREYRDSLVGSIGTRASVHPWVSTWTGSVIPYAYDSSVSASRRAEFDAPLRGWGDDISRSSTPSHGQRIVRK